MKPAPWRNRLSFGLGTLGRDMSAALVSMYLMFYLTEVLHISQSATAVVTVVLVAMRIFDALNDPFMGVIVDNTRSRFGKFKPWIALGAVLRGETYHFEIISNDSSRGLMEVQLDTGIPVANGILTCETDAQAQVRTHEKGTDCARAAVEMAHLLRAINERPA